MGGIASQWEGKHLAFEVFCVLSISHKRIISTNLYNKVSFMEFSRPKREIKANSRLDDESFMASDAQIGKGKKK